MSRLPLLAVGAGSMGRAWLRTVLASPDAELVGLVEVDPQVAAAALQEVGRPDLPTGADLLQLAERTGARAVLDVTPPPAHHAVTSQALFAGLPVLGEKPVAETLAQALSLAAASEVTGQLFMVSQSRWWNPQVASLAAMTGALGPIGSVSVEFFRGPHFGGFREQMADPLLVDMAIHAFDTARHLVRADPVSVSCTSWNPPWSWFGGDADATAVFTMADGSRFTWTGSWCATGAQTSWNGHWRVNGAGGSALWDGDTAPSWHGTGPAPASSTQLEGIAGALQVFCSALRSGRPPVGQVHENIQSLAMVEAAVASARSGGPVQVEQVLEGALAQARVAEQHPEVRERLNAWPSARAALAAGRSEEAVAQR